MEGPASFVGRMREFGIRQLEILELRGKNKYCLGHLYLMFMSFVSHETTSFLGGTFIFGNNLTY